MSVANLFSRGVWPVLDQGLFAISNFIVNILLARWLTLQEYGAFVTAFSVLLLFGTLHTALITEPLLIYSPGRYKQRVKEYTANILAGHCLFSLLTSTMLICVVAVLLILGQKQHAQAVIGLLIAQPFILLAWLTRRLCYCHFTLRLAVLAGTINLFLTLLGCYILFSAGILSPFTAFILIGICSLLSSCFMLFRLFTPADIFNTSVYDREFFSVHLNYGRWALPSSLLTWIPANIYYLLLPFWGHIELVALLKAQNNILTPLLQVNSAFAIQLIPVFVQRNDQKQRNKLSRHLLLIFMTLSLLYWVMLYLFADTLMLNLYGVKFVSNNQSLLILGLLPLLTGIIAVIGSAIRADDQPEQIFWSYLYASIFSVSIGVWLMIRWGLMGTSIAIVMSYLVVTAVMSCYYLKNEKKRNSPDEG